MNDNVYSQNGIINIKTNKLSPIEDLIESESPSPRGFHKIKKFGVICLLYGGKTSNGENFSDVWKFNINLLKWIKIIEPKLNQLYLYRSGYFFTTISGTERPIIYGGENRNKELNNDLIILDYPICTTNSNIYGSNMCLPCAEGYFLNKNSKCEQCLPGTYHSYKLNNYIDSKCDNCPIATFNNELAAKSKNKCRICDLGTYNNEIGSPLCRKCPKNKLCLTGNLIIL